MNKLVSWLCEANTRMFDDKLSYDELTLPEDMLDDELLSAISQLSQSSHPEDTGLLHAYVDEAERRGLFDTFNEGLKLKSNAYPLRIHSMSDQIDEPIDLGTRTRSKSQKKTKA